MMSVSNCLECGKALTGKQRSFCSTKCKNQHFLGYAVLKKRANERKERLIADHGGACSRCGHTTLSALSFYDTNGKSLNIGINELANLNFQKLEDRTRDALVLCRNCYEEFHNPMFSKKLDPLFQGDDGRRDCFVPRNDVKVEPSFTKSLKLLAPNYNPPSLKATERTGLPTTKFLLAVSGGVDSIVMLDLFAKSVPAENLIVAHLNHGFRPEADDDERFVRELARSYCTAYVTEKISPPESGNLEEYFRDKRREFLTRAAEENQCDHIALAHNANDQAETVLMNLVRGSGPAGLSGMKERDGLIIRPLLGVSRAEIEAYAMTNHLAWVEDVTNTDTNYTRNYLRHEVLPLLARVNPEYLANIARSAKIQEEITELQITHSTGSGPTANYKLQNNNDRSDLYHEVAREYEELTGSRKSLAKAHIDLVAEMLADTHGTKKVDLPHGVEAVSHYGTLEIRSKMSDNGEPKPGQVSLKIGKNSFGSWLIKVEKSPILSFRPNGVSGEISQNSRRDPSSKVGMTSKLGVRVEEKLFKNLIVKSVNAGDKIDAYGTRGHKKLQDLYVDAKIDKDKRARWPILVDLETGEVIWVPGLAIAKSLVPQTGNILITVQESRNEAKKEK